MSGGSSDYIRKKTYPAEVQKFIDYVRTSSDKQFAEARFCDFMNNGAWKTRGDGRYVADNQRRYSEETAHGIITITVTNPLSDWREWIKTLNGSIKYQLTETKTGFIVEVLESDIKTNPSLGKIFRQIFRKAAYCGGCRVCAANCKNGRIDFESGKIRISDCLKCLDCHNLPSGCLLHDSLKIPKGGKKMRAINSFNDHAPKPEWIASFFEIKEQFFVENTLGPDQKVKFNVFLADAELAPKRNFSAFAELISQIGWETDTAMGLILINLISNNPQFEWYVKNLEIAHQYMKKSVMDMLLAEEVKSETSASSVVKAFKRIVETALGTNLRFGFVTDEGELVRTKCSISDSRVVLYGLFKFAEKCNGYKEFTLATLLNDGIERDGISPTRIFGLDREEIVPMLLGLTAKYPEFITAAFTHDLEKITLAEHMSSHDVLTLFKESR
jgi:phosphoadenosine phosphosulfate reductase